MQVRFSKHFWKSYNRAGPKIKSTFDHKLEFFLKDPFRPSLNNHPLKGKLAGFRSINVTGDWRAIYSIDRDETTAVFELLGTHSQLYK